MTTLLSSQHFSLRKITTALCFLFLLVFPKGGFKIGPIPMTWGYLFLGLAALVKIVLRSVPRGISRNQLLVLSALLPVQVIFFLKLMIAWTDDIGFTISFFATFFILPWMCCALFKNNIENLDERLFGKWIVGGITFVSVYGILIFFLKLYTGSFIEIPYITLNAGDMGSLEEKCNMRGDLFKLISTYNNGNIFGVCTLMLMPLLAYFSKSFWPKAVFRVALLLTLSRTVWIGLLLYELFFARKLSRGLLWAGVGLVGIIITTGYVATDAGGFLLDTELGGRLDFFKDFEVGLFPSIQPFDGITEIIYIGFLRSFGVLGFGAFLVALGLPITLSLNQKSIYDNPFKIAIVKGLILYLILAGSDGALLFIPTMAFYWFLVGMLLFIPNAYGAQLKDEAST